MDKSNEGESKEKSRNETISNGGNGNDWNRVIDYLIQEIEMVSKHFNYTEEYVMSHTPAWVNRKFKQAQREQFAEHQTKVLGGFQSALLLFDAIFNKGKEFNQILPPSIEDAMKSSLAKQEIENQFVTGVWWGKSK